MAKNHDKMQSEALEMETGIWEKTVSPEPSQSLTNEIPKKW